ncbi:hypothetical protein PVK06_009152 [Gossypium arboreum]|uniref:Reverse transcriptase zinc-binding domain-containing protein n=1 Tax=Gossypium arboreum TaxID=29729 RepID=A0ABR0QMJ8_GOSAR|nr:hypothetical protein PVK06_009152 [Gossypium arboreum]
MNSPRINHLFFADNALLFVSNKKSDAECIVNILRNFAIVSGQEINFEKLMVLFSPKNLSAQRRNFGDLLGMNTLEKLDKYLSLPLPIEALKNGIGWQIGNGDHVNIQELGLGRYRFYWKTIWKLDTLPKIWVFSWHVGHGLLPMNVKIASIKNGFDQGCPSYEVIAETLIHALKYCPMWCEVLSIGGWDMSTMSRQYDHCIDWLEDMMRALDKRAMADLMTTLWNCLNNRNNFLLKAIKKWEKLPKGAVKINFDANRMGYGMIIRDDDGFVLGGGAGFIEKKVSVHETDALHLREALSWCVSSILMATCSLKPTMLVL